MLPPQMRDPVLFAIPFFLLLLILEWTAARKLERIETAGTDNPDVAHVQRPGAGAYMTRDSWASISMGLVSVATKQIVNTQRIYPPLIRSRIELLAAAAPDLQARP